MEDKPNNGSTDYRMVKLRSYPKPMDRKSAEGTLIMELEQLQAEGKVICLKSKEDFQQCHSATISYSTGSNL